MVFKNLCKHGFFFDRHTMHGILFDIRVVEGMIESTIQDHFPCLEDDSLIGYQSRTVEY